MCTQNRMQTLIAVVLLSLLTGCISPFPTPGYARKGDVINLNLGGFKRNLGGQLLKVSDLTVTITDDDGVMHTPEIMGVFRAYPDHGSYYAVLSQDRDDSIFGQANEFQTHDGAVWVSLRLSVDQNTVLPLADGPATISITSAKLTQTGATFEGAYSNIPLTILEGTGTPGPFDQPYEIFKSYPYLLVQPDPGGSAFAGVVGGLQLEIMFDNALTTGDPIQPYVYALNHDPKLSLIQAVNNNGDGTSTLRAILTNPKGFTALDSIDWDQFKSSELDLQLGIMSYAGGFAVSATLGVDQVPVSADLWVVSANTFYVDINGNPILDPLPVVVNEF